MLKIVSLLATINAYKMYIKDHNQWKYRAHGRVGHGKKQMQTERNN